MKKIIANKNVFVQGDVPALKLSALPEGAKLAKSRIVAYGEVTGHHHTINGGTCYDVETDIAGKLFRGVCVVVADGETAEMTHNSGGEHDVIEMTPGVWFIPAPGQQQREYDGENERRVLD